MLGGGAGVDIAVTPGLLVACTADTDRVAMKEGWVRDSVASSMPRDFKSLGNS
jgi:hypothetical protein